MFVGISSLNTPFWSMVLRSIKGSTTDSEELNPDFNILPISSICTLEAFFKVIFKIEVSHTQDKCTSQYTGNLGEGVEGRGS